MIIRKRKRNLPKEYDTIPVWLKITISPATKKKNLLSQANAKLRKKPHESYWNQVDAVNADGIRFWVHENYCFEYFTRQTNLIITLAA